ncbi:hypothetical protein BJ875DRAFT_122947 [Amylocarpus encephaloides]|uniref:Uncharacterized protein n=1 Tax=Amylocarpus encephaloides TaxID=45428 RepID=A0A9P7YDR1_9HELO|nr:hypothetical protein BJ875DRAFT_122947 [Amylocarpus encephaloides]
MPGAPNSTTLAFPLSLIRCRVNVHVSRNGSAWRHGFFCRAYVGSLDCTEDPANSQQPYCGFTLKWRCRWHPMASPKLQGGKWNIHKGPRPCLCRGFDRITRVSKHRMLALQTSTDPALQSRLKGEEPDKRNRPSSQIRTLKVCLSEGTEHSVFDSTPVPFPALPMLPLLPTSHAINSMALPGNPFPITVSSTSLFLFSPTTPTPTQTNSHNPILTPRIARQARLRHPRVSKLLATAIHGTRLAVSPPSDSCRWMPMGGRSCGEARIEAEWFFFEVVKGRLMTAAKKEISPPIYILLPRVPTMPPPLMPVVTNAPRVPTPPRPLRVPTAGTKPYARRCEQTNSPQVR